MFNIVCNQDQNKSISIDLQLGKRSKNSINCAASRVEKKKCVSVLHLVFHPQTFQFHSSSINRILLSSEILILCILVCLKGQDTYKKTETRMFYHKCKSFLILFRKERLPLVFKSSTSAKSKTAHTHFFLLFFFLPILFVPLLFFLLLKSIQHIHFKQCEKKWMTEPQRFDFYNFFFLLSLVCLLPLSYTPKYNIKRTIFFYLNFYYIFFLSVYSTTMSFVAPLFP